MGELNTLAWFDKPDPLDGPYFEETIYVTPSRLPSQTQEKIRHAVQRACRLAGLVTGPVHAEMRVNAEGVWLLEVAARSIGGLCGTALNHVLGITLEELILRHALNEPVALSSSREGAGVMMIPIPGAVSTEAYVTWEARWRCLASPGSGSRRRSVKSSLRPRTERVTSGSSSRYARTPPKPRWR